MLYFKMKPLALLYRPIARSVRSLVPILKALILCSTLYIIYMLWCPQFVISRTSHVTKYTVKQQNTNGSHHQLNRFFQLLREYHSRYPQKQRKYFVSDYSVTLRRDVPNLFPFCSRNRINTKIIPLNDTSSLKRSADHVRFASKLPANFHNSQESSENREAKETTRTGMDVKKIEMLDPKKDELSEKDEESIFNLTRFPAHNSQIFKAQVLEPLPNVCNGSDPFLLVLTLSMPDHGSKRQLLRETWATVLSTTNTSRQWPHYGQLRHDARILFIVGVSDSVSPKLLIQESYNLNKEQRLNKDMLFVNVKESYRHLTEKMLQALRFVFSCCPGVKFVLKADEDTFVNVPLLVDFLDYHDTNPLKPLANSVFGYMYDSPLVLRTGKWRVGRSLYPPRHFPSHVSGASYVISGDSLQRLLEISSLFSDDFPVEDVFITGITAKIAGLKRHNVTAMARRNILRGQNNIDACDLLVGRLSVTDMETQDIQNLWKTEIQGICSLKQQGVEVKSILIRETFV